MNTGTLGFWWPVTYDFGLIRAETETVAATWTGMHESHGHEVASTPVQGALHDCFLRLEPLSAASKKVLFLATTFGWTAYFAGGIRGSDPFLPMSRLSNTLGATALRVCVTPGTATYQGVILEVYDTPVAGGDAYGYRRSIAAVNDGGRWVFHQSGTPFPFEDISKYDARRKRDRFTPEMLASYLEQLGVPALSDEALQPGGRCSGFLISRPVRGNLRGYSLEEAKNAFG